MINSCLQDKIKQLDLSQPYVWKLKLSEADFLELEASLKSDIAQNGVTALCQPENALTTIVYMAEWYKRRYKSGNKNTLIEGLDLGLLWKNSGISMKNYVYRDENGNERKLYSIYVLGGLALAHELGRGDGLRFMKALCRLYRGENYTIENLDDVSRAVAFRESIKRKHSLYEFMKEILNGGLPFHPDDLADTRSIANRFVEVMKRANDEILRNKFRFEWEVNNSPDSQYMTRALYVWFKPEEVGGGLSQYLKFDRVHLWGITNPEKHQHLYVYIRFKQKGEVVAPSTMNQPLITYLNHGVDDFVAFGAEDGVKVKSLPSQPFDTIELVVKDDEGREYIAQAQPATEYIQLWRKEAYGTVWTSRQNAQKETALLFSNHCHLQDESAFCDVQRKSFKDNTYGISQVWNWIYIYDKVTFIDDKGKELTLYNRIGYDQVTTHLYSDTIHYIHGGKAIHCYIDDPDYDSEPETDEWPLIFGKQDIIVRHFATKDAILNAEPESDTVPEIILFENGDGRYVEWGSSCEPTPGEVNLKVSVKGRYFLYTVIYLPGWSDEQPIVRDFETACIRYRKLDGQEAVVQDEIPMNYIPLQPTVSLKYGDDENYYEVEVYRPTLLKEVMIDGKLTSYYHDGDSIDLPYLFKDRVCVNDFSIHGYQSYACKNIGTIYTEAFLNIAGNPSIGWAALSAWLKDNHYAATLLDPMAPACLTVCFGLPEGSPQWEGKKSLSWNYDSHEEPKMCSPNEVLDFGIIFQDATDTQDLNYNYPKQFDDDPWGFEEVDVSVMKCFEVASETGTYFFLMQPLRDLSKTDIQRELIEPLMEQRGGQLTEKDKQGLMRLAEENGFAWQELNFDNDNNIDTTI